MQPGWFSLLIMLRMVVTLVFNSLFFPQAQKVRTTEFGACFPFVYRIEYGLCCRFIRAHFILAFFFTIAEVQDFVDFFEN